MPSPDSLLLDVESAAQRHGFILDPAQRDIVQRVVRVVAGCPRGPRGRGVYVHGPAGRGKTWIADAVFTALPRGRATRVHFHGFFDDLHRRIHAHRGSPDATRRAVDDVLGRSRVVFFDELHVHDPGDARLLTRLLERIVETERILIATSNYAPDELLPDPVWHHLFEPGIALLTTHLDVCRLDGPTDYRTRPRKSRDGFRSGTWSTAVPARVTSAAHRLVVRDRTFTVLFADDRSLVATFEQLCDAPVAATEYRQWSVAHPRWTIMDVPPLDQVGPSAQQRFVTLIDVLVDADVPLDVFSRVDLEEFLTRAGGRPDAFRMGSRLRLLHPV